jgi:hypothetical protein
VKQVLEKFNLQFKSEEELLDVCLLSLTIVSYSLVKRPELMASLDQLMIENLPRLIDPNQSPLIRSRMCLFFSFYLDQLFST